MNGEGDFWFNNDTESIRCNVDCSELICACSRPIPFVLRSLLALRLPDSDLAEFPLLVVLEE